MSSTINDQINDAKETLSAAKEAACSHGCTPRNGALALTDGEFNIKYREFRFATAPFSATAQPVWKAVQAATDDLASLIRDKQAIDSAAALAAAMQLTATLTAQVSSLAGHLEGAKATAISAETLAKKAAADALKAPSANGGYQVVTLASTVANYQFTKDGKLNVAGRNEMDRYKADLVDTELTKKGLADIDLTLIKTVASEQPELQSVVTGIETAIVRLGAHRR